MRNSKYGLLVLFALAVCCTRSIDKSQPSCDLFVSPLQGDTNTVFFLSGEKSTSQENIPYGLSYYWTLDDTIQIESDSGENKTAVKINSFGIHHIKLTVKNCWDNIDSQTKTILVEEYQKDSICIDPRDGQKYRIALYGDYWWFTENLRFGTQLNIGEEPQDNSVVEMYLQDYDSGDKSGYYSWQEAHQYSLYSDTSICPPGWSLPNDQAVRYFINSDAHYHEEYRREMYINGCFSKLALRSEAIYYDMDNNLFKKHTPAFLIASKIINDKNNNPFSDMIYFWGTTPFLVSYNIGPVTSQEWYPKTRIAVPIRCIKKK